MAVDKLEWSKLTADATPLTPPMIQKKTLYSQCILSSNNGTGIWMYPGMAVDELERFSEIEKKIFRPNNVIPISDLTKPSYNSCSLTLSQPGHATCVLARTPVSAKGSYRVPLAGSIN